MSPQNSNLRLEATAGEASNEDVPLLKDTAHLFGCWMFDSAAALCLGKAVVLARGTGVLLPPSSEAMKAQGAAHTKPAMIVEESWRLFEPSTPSR